MKKQLLLTSIFLTILIGKSFAQCPGCLIDSSITTVGIYPDTLPDGIKNQAYDEDITFIMFTDTLGLQVYTFQIISVSGLPAGLSWECNNAGSGCTYDPSLSIFGCVKICGTPLQAGLFNMNVTVIADIAFVGPQIVSFVRPFNIVQGSSTNAGFSTSPASACPNTTVQFTSIIPALNYTWDFSNGLIDSVANPSTSYINPGDYQVTQNALLGFNLDSISINGVPYNYYDDGIAGNDSFPDIYYSIFDSAGINIFNSVTQTDATFPLLFDSITQILTNQNYTIKVYDYDLLGGGDTLGQITFNGTTISGTLTDSIPGVNDLLSVSWWSSPVVIINSDSVHIFAPPVAPVISSSGNDSICAGDSVLLAVPFIAGNIIQWYNDTIILLGSNDTILWVNQSGNYFVNIQDTNGCAVNSFPYNFTVVPNPPKPTYSASGNTLTCYLTGYNLQWFVNGTLIPGATDTILNATVQGLYNVVASNDFGCSTTSDTVLLTGVGLNELEGINKFEILPSSGNGIFNLEISSNQSTNVQITISDVSGRIISDNQFNLTYGVNKLEQDISASENGMYLINLKGNDFQIVNRYLKLK